MTDLRLVNITPPRELTEEGWAWWVDFGRALYAAQQTWPKPDRSILSPEGIDFMRRNGGQ